MAKRRNLLGRRFGRLTVVRWLGVPRSRWACRCSCGRRAVVQAYYLVRGRTRSCGCLRVESTKQRFTTHGWSRKTEHIIWLSMIARCYNARHRQYSDYGGRGIRVCARWRRSFAAFLADMGRRPSLAHSIDRFPDNNGNYCKRNCRWATRSQQMQNTRKNRYIVFRGKRLCMSAWASAIGVTGPCISYRLDNGWSLEDALTTPSRRPTT